MKRNFLNYRIKLLCFCFAVWLIIVTILHITIYNTARQNIEIQISRGALSTAVAIAHVISNDIERYKAFEESGDITSDYFKEMQTLFQSVKEHTYIRFIYTESMLDEETVVYILDGTDIEHEDFSAPGDLDELTPQAEYVFRTGRPNLYPLVDYGEWGVLIGAAAPIFDTDGSVHSILGVSVDASTLEYYLNNLQIGLYTTYLVILTILMLLVFRSSASIFDNMYIDKLTGAYTKRAVETILGKEIKKSYNKKDLSIMMLDLDYFKKVNDIFGHNFGDDVLSSTAHLVLGMIRQTDCLIRYGGEEFLLILPDTPADKAFEVAERIRIAISKKSRSYREGDKNAHSKLNVTISIGVAHINNEKISTRDFIERADNALYKAKEDRNKVVLYTVTK